MNNNCGKKNIFLKKNLRKINDEINFDMKMKTQCPIAVVLSSIPHPYIIHHSSI